MRFRFTPRAASEADREQAWWREHRPKAPDLFDEELEQAIGQIVHGPTVGTIYPCGFPDVVRRVLGAASRVLDTTHRVIDATGRDIDASRAGAPGDAGLHGG